MAKVLVIEVSQFFDWHKMKWKDLLKGREKGVLPSTDKTVFLWSEKPELKMVSSHNYPQIGNIWLKNKGGKPVVYKANYDSSD